MKLKEKLLNLYNKLKNFLKDGRFIYFYSLFMLIIFIIVNSPLQCARSPTNTAKASENTIGGSEYVYSLPPITLSNKVVTSAFIPNVFVCLEPTAVEMNDKVYLYTLTGNASRNNFNYGKRSLTYDSNSLDWRLTDFKIVTVYGFNVTTNGTGNAVNWSSEAGAIIVNITNLGSLINNHAIFNVGEYYVTNTSVTYRMENVHGAIDIVLPYTSYNNSITDYSGTFSPTRVVESSAGYSNGYAIGKEEGFELGKIEGLREGLNTSIGDLNPFEVVKMGVDEILDIQIFGGIRFSDMLKLTFGLSLLGIFIKLLLR